MSSFIIFHLGVTKDTHSSNSFVFFVGTSVIFSRSCNSFSIEIVNMYPNTSFFRYHNTPMRNVEVDSVSDTSIPGFLLLYATTIFGFSCLVFYYSYFAYDYLVERFCLLVELYLGSPFIFGRPLSHFRFLVVLTQFFFNSAGIRFWGKCFRLLLPVLTVSVFLSMSDNDCKQCLQSCNRCRNYRSIMCGLQLLDKTQRFCRSI